MQEIPEFSLIFVNYRSARYLSRALRSLFASEKKGSFEVIVVNNDEKEERVLQGLRQFFPFQLIQSGSNIGFGAANNIGVSVARGSLIGFLNPDTFWEGEKLPNISRSFSSYSNGGVLGLGLIDGKGERETWSAGRFPTLFRIVWNNIAGGYFLGQDESVEWVSGGALFIRKDVFQGIGGFDERFFLYFEDVDLCVRVKEIEYEVRLDPQMNLRHYGGKSHFSRGRQKMDFFRSQDRYFRKHRPWEYVGLRVLRFLRYGF